MSQFRMRASSASKSTQTESKIDQSQGFVENDKEDIDAAVLPENVDLERELRTQDLHSEAPQKISKHVCLLNDDEEDDGLLALEETRC